MSRYFLQEPCVAIGITEVDILDAPQIVHLAHLNTPVRKRLAALLYVGHDPVQPLDCSKLHCRNFAQTGPRVKSNENVTEDSSLTYAILLGNFLSYNKAWKVVSYDVHPSSH